MDPSLNPFLRGYTHFTITRMLLIDGSDGTGICRRALHCLHAELSDAQLAGTFCQYNEHFAVVPERQSLPESLQHQCPNAGFVFAVVHSVTGQHGDSTVHVGDSHSADAAQEILRQLTFNTGQYSRCWEISTKHLPQSALRWLERWAGGRALSTYVLFNAFDVPGSRGAVGCMLHSTPWSDDHLRLVAGWNALFLRSIQESERIPPSLLTVLHLAAAAHTRILIFDPDAPVLEGLSLPE